jgi:uncharacterized zinc-type alcohol dehydrogenase-like protein
MSMSMLATHESTDIQAWAAQAPKAPLRPFRFAFGPLGPGEVEIEISHCGVCRSDVHLVDDDWGRGRYPMVPGHEIVGEVRAWGSAVDSVARGERVGVGWQAGSCGHCHVCEAGDDNLCAEQQRTCVGRHGGFAERIRVDARFVYAIPEGLRSELAAPLLCAGATVFAPLERRKIGPGARVGVIGLGGLGHLGVQFARAFGAEVTVFSSSAGKAELARELGATRVVDSHDADAIKAERGRHDLILSTVDVDLDWGRYLRALRPGGDLCFLGVPEAKLAIPIGVLVDGQRSVSGSMVASPAAMRRTLVTAAEQGVAPIVELFPMADAERGLARVRDGAARLRVVLAH